MNSAFSISHTNEIIHYLSCSSRLISLSIITQGASMSSQMAESPSFSWQSNIPLQTHIWASQVVQLVKNLPSHAGDTGDVSSIPGSCRSPGVGNGNPLQHSCLQKLLGQQSLSGYSQWGCREQDMTEQLKTHTHTHTHSFSCM